jgi:hypothetical protein
MPVKASSLTEMWWDEYEFHLVSSLLQTSLLRLSSSVKEFFVSQAEI